MQTKVISWMGIAAAAVCLAGAPTWAEKDGPAGKPGAAREQRGPKGDHVARMKAKLGLTDDQAAKLKAAFDAQKAAMQPLKDQQKAAYEKLKGQVEAKAPDQEIQTTLDSLRSTHKAIAEQHDKFIDSLTFLTPTQRAKMALSMGRRMGGRMGGQMGMGMKGDGPMDGHDMGDKPGHSDMEGGQEGL